MATRSNEASNAERPLSWKEARLRLRDLLERYQSNPPYLEKKRRQDSSEENPVFSSRKWLKWDLDLYLGTFGSSLAILIIASLGTLQDTTDRSVRTSQLVGAVLMFAGCLFNLWVVRRRKFSISKGSDSLRRREIHKFLKALEKQEEEFVNSSCEGFEENLDPCLNLAGNSLTDIYPVYRLFHRPDGATSTGSWSRIPSLLLVEGDHIALQVGDTVPADCKVVDGPSSRKKILAGQRITLDTFGQKTNKVMSNLPRGRTTMKNDSDHLLTLCNQMRIFVLLDSPLESFLHQRKAEQREPQSSRQLERIRVLLSVMGIPIFVLTAIILFSRLDQNMDLYLALPVPFLAAIGVFPFIGPACLIFIEALGTARILTCYHPVASLSQERSPDSEIDRTNILLIRYFIATALNRLSLQDLGRKMHHILCCLCRFCRSADSMQPSKLVRVPPASLNLLEKLGVATAFTLVDDELVCEPDAIPQQLLIPSGKGLKLLDICPTYDSDSDDSGDSESELKRDGSSHDSDSDSEDGLEYHHHYNIQSTRRKRRRFFRRAPKKSKQSNSDDSDSDESDNHDAVQFEDPSWWQHLPTLKCIGLACLLVEERDLDSESVNDEAGESKSSEKRNLSGTFETYKKDLVHLICAEQRSRQLRSLARCIGFSTKVNKFGKKGDISPFTEKERLHVVSTARLKESLEIDSHQRGSEESRWWGYLRPDSTSVIVQDSRSGSYQLLTVGDPRIVTRFCHQAWQGENATILPLTAHDRATILETSNGWKLGDLASTAFSYTPIPPSFKTRIQVTQAATKKFYLLDNDPKGESLLPIQKDKAAPGLEWSLLSNQIFLGVLGSLVVPRQETQGLLSTLQDAGVRFVYFSPRNMRLTKEIASQMGIDVAWNCAISLRPLDQGEEDPHRMVSTYADWDVNAKLPHGIESVKRHLEDVDNVPLLVSLFTDVTKETTMQMIETFQEYNDTVITVGLSHLPWNSRIFSTADLSVGVDILSEFFKANSSSSTYNSLLPSEIDFISAISAHLCAFRLCGVSAIDYIPTILAHARASLEAATSASLFLVSGCISFGFYVLFSVCSASIVLPEVTILWTVLYLQLVLPLVGLSLTMSDPDKESMHRVPPKNDPSITFGKKEGKDLLLSAILKAITPAIFPQILYLICFGEFMIYFQPDILSSVCSPNLEQGDWASTIRCDGLQPYSEDAQRHASSIAIAGFILSVVVASTAFVHRTLPVYEEPPWQRNYTWVFSSILGIVITGVYLYSTLEAELLEILPWYAFLLFFMMPLFCLTVTEVLKRKERYLLSRAEKLRRLQFETRLGMWSPK